MNLRALSLLIAFSGATCSFAGMGRFRFIIIDPKTKKEVNGSVILVGLKGTLEAPSGRVMDLDRWTLSSGKARTLIVPLGKTIQVPQDRPVKEFTIHVTAKLRTLQRANAGSSSTERTKEQIKKFVNTDSGDIKNLTKGQKGVAEDSAGQQHVRGEHTDITYVVDGVPLPDTLSGRQGSIVVPSTIDSLEIITGGFAPEFGGQTAAVLNIATTPSAKGFSTDVNLGRGTDQSINGGLVSVGPLGKRASFVLNFGSEYTKAGLEPLQPYGQDVHNAASSKNFFGKLNLRASEKDRLSLTLSNSPDSLQIANRLGLSDAYAAVGEGYGFGGLRNADGTRPDVGSGNEGALGSERIRLKSQQDSGMDIDQHEVSEFAVLNWQHAVSASSSFQLAATLLHSGQEVTNNNPGVNIMDLPVDSSIEYNPTAIRNVHHVQVVGSYDQKSGSHRLKFGFLVDNQSGHELYQIVAASRLALDELAALDPGLAPQGTASGTLLDVNGNPVFTPKSGVTPTLQVSRSGSYKAVYAQDSWSSGRLNANYGIRWDSFFETQNLGQEDVRSSAFSPRLNFSYRASGRDVFRWSYNKLFNTPPTAQGAIVGAPIQPEILNQYDLAYERKLGKGQTFSAAYYYKDIRNQVDVGLLIPGSQIGLYSAVNDARGAVHGVELSYDLQNWHGWDGYANFTHSAARPNGLDNTGAPVPDFNDHDQTTTLGLGLAYSFKNGATAATTVQYGSGLSSSIVTPNGGRTPRTQVDMRFSTGDKLFAGKGGLSLDIDNVFDERKVINFQSAFSGTRFMIGRRFSLGANFKF